MTQYLLGQLPEQEQIELERGYMVDDTLFEELLATEDDLRDAYLRGELSERDRAAFEQRLLSVPHQKQKQEFAQTLRQYLNESDTQGHTTTQLVARCKALLRTLAAPRRLVLVPTLSAALVLLIVGSWWLGHRKAQPIQSRNGPGPAASMPTPEAAIGGPSPQEPETNTITLVLNADSVRGGGSQASTLVITPNVSWVRLEPRVTGDYPRYQAVVETVEGRRIWSQGNLVAHAFSSGKRVLINLSSNLLPPQDYIVTVRGLPAGGIPETVAEYTFRVERR